MIIFKNELPLDHTESIESWVNLWTKSIQEDNEECNMGTNWDCCKETAWNELEWWLEDNNLEMIR